MNRPAFTILCVPLFVVVFQAQQAAAQDCSMPSVHTVDVTIALDGGKLKASDPGTHQACEGDTVIWRIRNTTNRSAYLTLGPFEKKTRPGYIYPVLGVGVYSRARTIGADALKVMIGEIPTEYNDLAGDHKYTLSIAGGHVTDPEIQITPPPSPPVKRKPNAPVRRVPPRGRQ